MLGSRNNQHSFAETPNVYIGRSMFDRSHSVKDTFDFDYLCPVLIDEVIPGDTFSCRVASFARLATQIVPVMDNMYLDWFFFYVPNRLLWTNWEKFMGAQDNPGDSTTYVVPSLATGGTPAVDSIFDKMGVPTGITNLTTQNKINALPYRAYNLIWKQWFRDENLQNSPTINTGDGPDALTDYALLKRGKRFDYFTGCLPWPQKGTAVSMPIGTSAPVYGTGKALGLTDGTTNFSWAQINGSSTPGYSTAAYNTTLGTTVATANASGTKSTGVVTSGVSGLYADLSTATAATIAQLREALLLQSLMELNARAGTRYVEILRAHFGVVSPDFRLQRAEYLGGGSVTINSHPVAQTSPTSGSNAQGQLAAFGTAAVSPNDGIGFSKSFVEHGFVIGMVCARADITYQQGLHKMWSRQTKYDYFWPKLQQLGEQAVLNKELYAQGTSADDLTFGYQERYGEYRYKPSEIRGRFRSTYATPLDMWHMAEKFTALPVLNSSFIVQNTPIDRAIAVSTQPDMLIDIYFNLRCARPMTTYATPATLGRF